MLNVVCLGGRLTKDPELRYTASGRPVCGFVLAVDRDYRDDEGNRPADFIPVVAWGQMAEFCAQYLSKGRLVNITGRIQTRSYETDDGGRRRTVEVIADSVYFMDRPKGGERHDA